MTYGRTTPDLDRPGGDIPPDSPYVADTMPTLAKAPRYRSACGLARDGSPPSAAYSPVVHPPPPPTLQNLPPPHNTHSTPPAPAGRTHSKPPAHRLEGPRYCSASGLA